MVIHGNPVIISDHTVWSFFFSSSVRNEGERRKGAARSMIENQYEQKSEPPGLWVIEGYVCGQLKIASEVV